MRSNIYEYVSKEDPSEFWIWIASNRAFKRDIEENARQLIRVLSIDHTEERWDDMMELDEEEMREELFEIHRSNLKNVIYPN